MSKKPNRLVALRRLCGITQIQLVFIINTTERAVSAWEHGAKMPGPLVAFCRAVDHMTAPQRLRFIRNRLRGFNGSRK